MTFKPKSVKPATKPTTTQPTKTEPKEVTYVTQMLGNYYR